MALLDSLLQGVYDATLDDRDGQAMYYDPDSFGIALVDVSGGVYTIGDTDQPFALQSMSKAFAFALALHEHGDAVFDRVNVEPSGDPYNSIVLNADGRAPNPLVNSGAITVTAMLHDQWGDDVAEHIRERFSDFAGAQLVVDEDIYSDEIATAHHNLAIANLLRSHDMIGDPAAAVAAYLRQCTVNVTAVQLATMAATIANLGTNPLTGKVVADPLAVRHTMAVMATCGMYDGAGRWMLHVGVPAKSGVSGGVVAVVNRQLGIGVWSPRLDENGNSVRALRACTLLAEELGLHVFELSNIGSSLLAAYLR